VIISGPSGVGKDSILEAMKGRTPAHPRHYVITVTTRLPRDGETDGTSYHFITRAEYDRRRDDDALLEASDVHDHGYGTPLDQVQSALVRGEDAILKIDVQGADKVREKVRDALLIFIVPPSWEELERRLRERKSDTPEEIERRLRNARQELARQGEFDHVVVNETGRVDETAALIDEIIADEHRAFPDRQIVV
jgi:guanylate kinase